MPLNTLREGPGARASGDLLSSAAERAHPLLKILCFILLTFLIFSKLSLFLQFCLILFTVSILYSSGCLRLLYKQLIALYLGIYSFLFFINWTFNKNPGFWDKDYLNGSYYDFVGRFSGIFSRGLFDFQQASHHSHSGNSSGATTSDSVLTGWFWGGNILKGCGNCKNCKCVGGSGTGVVIAQNLEELKKTCGCAANGGKCCQQNGQNCCNGSGGNCQPPYPDIDKVKTSVLISKEGAKKVVGYFSKWYTVTALQFLLAFNVANKLVMIIALSRALSFTTNLTAFTFAVGQLIKPLTWLRVPVKEITLIISLAIRFIPSLLIETMRIVKAQSSRGIDFKNGRYRDKASAFLSLFIPLFIISMIKSRELSNAMISRAYLPKADRTAYRSYNLDKSSLIVFSGVIFFIISCYYFVFSSYYFSPLGNADPLLLVATFN
ncbi:cobalt ABC transporter permease [Candidatus Mycoplasma haematolamae str. Purdue]|uniref:Cobalt ABC transporter permease n=1 Tax=Mycoplasma haematolamae (strain Purdue) TaxID=1212765 RepID=I7B931_MYCHA|nr:energy-coupling factor transporter transmembrane component T [Candidatus Mycoplasma haematolamae]AFO51775.1 cobalt ABC transporter permease [Candidatus Mycoplasma haematolamae str. Purdue]